MGVPYVRMCSQVACGDVSRVGGADVESFESAAAASSAVCSSGTGKKGFEVLGFDDLTFTEVGARRRSRATDKSLRGAEYSQTSCWPVLLSRTCLSSTFASVQSVYLSTSAASPALIFRLGT